MTYQKQMSAILELQKTKKSSSIKHASNSNRDPQYNSGISLLLCEPNSQSQLSLLACD